MVARPAVMIGPRMNTTSSTADSNAYAVLSRFGSPTSRNAHDQRVRTRAPNANCVAPIPMASTNSTGNGTRIMAARAKATSMETCAASAGHPTRLCPWRSNSRA